MVRAGLAIAREVRAGLAWRATQKNTDFRRTRPPLEDYLFLKAAIGLTSEARDDCYRLTKSHGDCQSIFLNYGQLNGWTGVRILAEVIPIKDMKRELKPEEREEIINAVAAGDRVTATSIYLSATEGNLTEAQNFIRSLTEERIQAAREAEKKES